jgi:putative membrane protein
VIDFLVQHFNVFRGLHILAVIAFMAGMLYLPRLYVYHTKATPGSRWTRPSR